MRFILFSELLSDLWNKPQSSSAILSLASLSLLPRSLPLLPFFWKNGKNQRWREIELKHTIIPFCKRLGSSD